MKTDCLHCQYQKDCKRKREFARENCPFFKDLYDEKSVQLIINNYQNKLPDSNKSLYEYIAHLLITEELPVDTVKNNLTQFQFSEDEAKTIFEEATNYINSLRVKNIRIARADIISGIIITIVGIILFIFLSKWFFVLIAVGVERWINGGYKLKQSTRKLTIY